MLTNLKIGRRLALAFGLIVLMMVIATGFAISGIRSMGKALELVHDRTDKIQVGNELEIQQYSRGLLTAGIPMMEDKAAIEDRLALVKTKRAEADELMKRLKEGAASETARQMTQEVEAAIQETKVANNKVVELAQGGKSAEARRLYLARTTETLDGQRKSFSRLSAFRNKQVEDAIKDAEALSSRVTFLLIITGLLATGAAVVLGLLLTRGITAPLAAAMGHLDLVAEGTLNRDISEVQLRRRDEIGDMARALQKTVEALRKAFRDVTQGSQLIASSSTELSALSVQMASGTRTTSQKASTVAAAAEEMSVNAGSVAAGMEQATASLSSISESTSQMTSTITEIAGNSEKARVITGEANRQAEGLGALMKELGRAAQEIGKVTETINNISSQTNLLALNATIEAARAGAAGKGFAVVANEIKELAQQTATATEDIKAKISGIQDSTSGAVEDIHRISSVIRDVSDIVSTIATAIEEQATVTRDIATSLSQASAGVRDANQRVAQSSSVTQEIARDIAGVDQSATEIATGVEQVKASAADLSRLAERLNQTIQQFRV